MLNTFLESRAINFFVNLTKILLASSIALSPDDYSTIAPIVLFFLIVVLPFLLGKSLHIVTVIGNRLHISDADFRALWIYIKEGVISICKYIKRKVIRICITISTYTNTIIKNLWICIKKKVASISSNINDDDNNNNNNNNNDGDDDDTLTERANEFSIRINDSSNTTSSNTTRDTIRIDDNNIMEFQTNPLNDSTSSTTRSSTRIDDVNNTTNSST